MFVSRLIQKFITELKSTLNRKPNEYFLYFELSFYHHCENRDSKMMFNFDLCLKEYDLQKENSDSVVESAKIQAEIEMVDGEIASLENTISEAKHEKVRFAKELKSFADRYLSNWFYVHLRWKDVTIFLFELW